MAFLSTATCHGLLLLLLVGGGACQRASYTFQQGTASPTAPQASTTSPETSVDTSSLVSVCRVAQAVRLPKRHKLRYAPPAARRAAPAQRLAQSWPPLTPRLRSGIRQGPAVRSPTDQPVLMRSRGVALLLAFLLFPLGFYNFYLGYHARGIVSLVLFVAALPLYALGALASLFGGGINAALIIGLILLAGLELWQLIDIMRIIANRLKPRDGEYYPRLFQTRPSATPPPR